MFGRLACLVIVISFVSLPSHALPRVPKGKKDAIAVQHCLYIQELTIANEGCHELLVKGLYVRLEPGATQDDWDKFLNRINKRGKWKIAALELFVVQNIETLRIDERLADLRSLSLTHTQVRKLEFAEAPKHLFRLSLESNERLETVTNLADLSSLVRLFVHKNEILQELPPLPRQAPMDKAVISGKGLKAIRSVAQDNLKDLHIARVISLEMLEGLDELPKLEKLNLYTGDIDEPLNLSESKNLRWLDLSLGYYTPRYPDIGELGKLETLILRRHVRISQGGPKVPPGIAKLENLSVVELHSGKLTDNVLPALVTLPNLKTVKVSYWAGETIGAFRIRRKELGLQDVYIVKLKSPYEEELEVEWHDY